MVDVFRFRLQKTSSRRLQDLLIKTNNIFAWDIHFQKTVQNVLIKTNIFVLVIRLQDVFKKSCKDIFKMFLRCLQDIFKTSCQDVFKTSSKHLQDILQKRLQDIFKTSCKNVFKTFSRSIIKFIITYQHISEKHYKDVYPQKDCLGHTPEKFVVSVQNLEEWQKFLKF